MQVGFNEIPNYYVRPLTLFRDTYHDLHAVRRHQGQDGCVFSWWR